MSSSWGSIYFIVNATIDKTGVFISIIDPFIGNLSMPAFAVANKKYFLPANK